MLPGRAHTPRMHDNLTLTANSAVMWFVLSLMVGLGYNLGRWLVAKLP